MHLPASEQNDRCLPLAGTSRIFFPRQLLEFFFNSAGATFPPSVRPHPTSSLSCLFILAVRARAFRLKVARSILVRTLPGIPRLKLSLFAMSPHHALQIPSLCPPFARLQCSPSALRRASFPSVSQKLLIYLSYERARGKLTRPAKEKGEERDGEESRESQDGRGGGWEGMRRNN